MKMVTGSCNGDEMARAKKETQRNRWTRDSEKELYWKSQVGLWQRSGLSVRAFCKEHGVIETSFYAWRRELILRSRELGSASEGDSELPPAEVPETVRDSRGRSIKVRFRKTDTKNLTVVLDESKVDSNPFVPLKVVDDRFSPLGNAGLSITTPRGYVISVPATDHFDVLARLLKLLEESSC